MSVIIPTYNRADLVGRAIRSVLAQTFQDWELFVVDDASIDNTEEVVRSFQDPRIHYLCHETNRGACAARNTAICASSGEYIALLDSDDEWLPQKLEKQLKLFHDLSHWYGVIFSDYFNCILDGTQVRGSEFVRMEENGSRETILFFAPGVISSTTLIRRSALIDVGDFNEAMPARQDTELWIRLSSNYSFYFLNEALTRKYQTLDSLTSHAERCLMADIY